MKKRVLVAMSGGVDSSVAAALLQQQGYEIEGITLKLTAGLCCDIGSAQAVCGHLGIPHRVLDAQSEFSRDVIGSFISEYQCGRTPNPCITCNELIKFRLLLDYARAHGFYHIATGHYARIEKNPATASFELKTGIDEHKDQSYFLYRLTQDQMSGVLFPIGSMVKTAVRALANEFGLPAAERPESQEICFVPNDDYRMFLKKTSPGTFRPGEIVMTDGKVVGWHGGIAFYTVGQRRKLGVAAGERLYVVGIDSDTNRVVLGKTSELQTDIMTASNVTFIDGEELSSPRKVMVRIRYRSPSSPAVIEPMADGAVHVLFEKQVRGVCPGQAAVFYDGNVVVGGGVIEAAQT